MSIKKSIIFFSENTESVLNLIDDMTYEEIGLYLTIKAAYIKNGGEMPIEKAQKYCRFYGNKAKFTKFIKEICEKNGDFYVNSEWDLDLKKIKEKSEKAKKAISKRWEKRNEQLEKWRKFEEDAKIKSDTDVYTDVYTKQDTNYKLLTNKKNIKKKNKYSEEFETFWKTFSEGSINTPLGSKKKAYELYKKCLKSHNNEQIIEGLKAYLAECKSKNTYTTAATTFLNQERYTDYLRPAEVIEEEKQKKEEIEKEKQRIRDIFKINKNHPKFNEIMSRISFLGEYTKKIHFIHFEDKKKIFIADSKFNRDWIDREFGTEIRKAFGDYKVITEDQYKLLFG